MAKKKGKRVTLKLGDCVGCGGFAKKRRGGKLCCKWCAKLTLPRWEGACIEWVRISTEERQKCIPARSVAVT